MDFEQMVRDSYNRHKKIYYDEIAYDPKKYGFDEAVIADWVCDDLDTKIKEMLRQIRTKGPQA